MDSLLFLIRFALLKEVCLFFFFEEKEFVFLLLNKWVHLKHLQVVLEKNKDINFISNRRCAWSVFSE